MKNTGALLRYMYVFCLMVSTTLISAFPYQASAAKFRQAPFELAGTITGGLERQNKNIPIAMFEGAWDSIKIEVIKDNFSGSWRWRNSNDANHVERMNVSGTYKNGYLVGTWEYSSENPFEDTNHGPYPKVYVGSGTFQSDFVEPEKESIIPVKVDGTLIFTFGDIDPKSEPGKGVWIQKEETQELHFTWNAKAYCMYDCSCDEGVGESIPTGAKYNSLTGTVYIQHCGQDPNSDWDNTFMNDVLYASDRIQTQRRSGAILQFADMNTYVMGPDTEITLNVPPEKDNWPKLNLVLGRLWRNTQLIIKEGRMEAETSQAVLGIKGTTFYVDADGEKTTVGVAEGLVTLTSKFSDRSVDIGPGQMAVADFTDVSEPTPIDATALMAEYEAAYADAASGRQPSPEDVVVEEEDNEVTEHKTEGSSSSAKVGFMIALLACIIGGAWVVKRKKKTGDTSN